MAQTTEVHIGPLKFQVTGPMAERLDEYNWDDGIFSPEDLLGVTTDDPAEAEQQAIDIVARASGSADGVISRRLKALIDVANQANTLAQSVRRLAAFHPTYWADLGLGKGELEFTATSWQAAGGAQAMKQVRREVALWKEAAATGASLFLNSPRSSVTKVYTGQVDLYGPLTEVAYDVTTRVRGEMATVRDFFRVEMERNRESDWCDYAADLECEGSGCPDNDEVTGDFCIPTF